MVVGEDTVAVGLALGGRYRSEGLEPAHLPCTEQSAARAASAVVMPTSAIRHKHLKCTLEA